MNPFINVKVSIQLIKLHWWQNKQHKKTFKYHSRAIRYPASTKCCKIFIVLNLLNNKQQFPRFPSSFLVYTKLSTSSIIFVSIYHNCCTMFPCSISLHNFFFKKNILFCWFTVFVNAEVESVYKKVGNVSKQFEAFLFTLSLA